MDLKTKPSDTPNNNNFFSLLTQQGVQSNQNSSSGWNNEETSSHKVNMISVTHQKQIPQTTRQTTSLQQFYESSTKPFLNAAVGAAA